MNTTTVGSQLDALLDAAEAEGQNPVDLFIQINERKRKRAHAKAKASQPALGIRGTVHTADDKCACHECLLHKLKAAWNEPITADEKSAAQGDIEYLVLTIQDCVDAGDVEDLLFATMRLSRKLLARNSHLWRAQDIQTVGKMG